MPRPEIHTANTPGIGLPPGEMARINEEAKKRKPAQWPLEKRAPSPDDQEPAIIDIHPPKTPGDSNTWEF